MSLRDNNHRGLDLAADLDPVREGPAPRRPEPPRDDADGPAWGAPAGATFWHGEPPDRGKLSYTAPPLSPREGVAPGADAAFRGLKEGIAAQYPLRAEALEWDLVNGPFAAAEEQRALAREADGRREERRQAAAPELRTADGRLAALRDREQAAAAALTRGNEEFGRAAAAAGLAWPEGDVTPGSLDAALREAVPTLDELAGEHGIPPPPPASGWSALSLAACVASGSLLALCLGTLVGLLSLSDLQRGDRLAPVALAALVGAATVGSLGGLVEQAAASLAEALRPPGPERLRPAGSFVIALLLAASAALLLAAEVGAEAAGMRELHGQALQAARRMQETGDSALLPMWAYVLVGTLVSGPYLGYRAAKAWSRRVSELQEAWLVREQRRWLEERRADPQVRSAFVAAARVEARLRERDAVAGELNAVEAEREGLRDDGFDPETRGALDRAREAGVGLSAEFRDTLAGLVDELEPLPRRRRGLRLWG